jgi:alkaline phosphatase D
MMRNFSRRDFLKLSASALAVASVSTMMSGCSSQSERSKLSTVTFNHGVASGDATDQAVILWTRAVPSDATQQQVMLAWQLATDPNFNQLLRSGEVTTSAERDFTIKIDVQELNAGQVYYYRFLGADNQSTVGRTKTLATGSIDSLKLAVFSCSNYPAGYFNVYREAALQANLDAVIHLGDYIYEYAGDGYATEKAKEIGRTYAENNNSEILSLADYRARYARNRTDQALQQLHATVPWYVVWDDHEIANDTWQQGAENHQVETEGDFTTRRLAAVKAYYEWLPIRPPQGEDSLQIYRSFDFGNLLSLHLLDTRVLGREEPLDYKNYKSATSGQFDAARFQQDMSKERALLGQEQFAWLQTKMQQSNSRWQILAQQILMSKMHLPAEIFATEDYSKIPAQLTGLVAAKQRVLMAQQAGKPADPTDLMRVSQVMPYNLDAWDGYAYEREMLYATVKALGKPLLVIAGDTHNAWYSILRDQQGAQVGVEFATPSVSSPGMEQYLQIKPEQADAVSHAFSLLINDLEWCNLHQRGFMMLHINQSGVECEWQFIDNILSPTYQVVAKHRQRFPQ